VRKAIQGSLERLRTNYVDLYYQHKPDPSTPIAETLGALDELVQEGTVRAIGCSNFSAEQLVEADRVARDLGTARFTVLQNHYSLLRRDDDADVLPVCRELGVSYIPYFPLASGLLTGKYERGKPAPEGTRLAGREIEDERFAQVGACVAFAEEHGHSIHELAICALASTPGVGSIIAGATKSEQVRANAAAAAAWQLTSDELDALAKL
jgi:aryl-alcohol dehydrogenase-like predicted oxidoreductase